jgi:hypothetical protein
MTATVLPAEHAATARRPDLAWALTGLSLALAVVLLPPLLVDPRLLDGVGVWVKPMKFAVSFVVYFGTIALVTDRMSGQARASLWVRATLVAMAVSMIGEMAYIIRQAGLAEPSHFNVGSPGHALLYTLMGIGAAVLVIGMGVIGWRAAADRNAALGPGTRLGVATGFVGSALLTLVVAFVLGGNGGHHVGVPSPGAPVIPILGWSAEVGDLRPAHFLSLHGMQVLPLVGLALDATMPRRARLGVAVATAAWAAATVAVFVQGLMGLPLVRL